MAQRFRALIAVAKDLIWVFTTHMAAHSHSYLQLQGLWLLHTLTHINKIK